MEAASYPPLTIPSASSPMNERIEAAAEVLQREGDEVHQLYLFIDFSWKAGNWAVKFLALRKPSDSKKLARDYCIRTMNSLREDFAGVAQRALRIIEYRLQCIEQLNVTPDFGKLPFKAHQVTTLLARERETYNKVRDFVYEVPASSSEEEEEEGPTLDFDPMEPVSSDDEVTMQV